MSFTCGCTQNRKRGRNSADASGSQDAQAEKRHGAEAARLSKPVCKQQHLGEVMACSLQPLAGHHQQVHNGREQGPYTRDELDLINKFYKEDTVGDLRQRSWTLQGGPGGYLYLYMCKEKSVDHSKEKRNAGAVFFTQEIVKQEEVCVVMLVSMAPAAGICRNNKVHLYSVGVGKAFDEAACKPTSLRDSLIERLDSNVVCCASRKNFIHCQNMFS